RARASRSPRCAPLSCRPGRPRAPVKRAPAPTESPRRTPSTRSPHRGGARGRHEERAVMTHRVDEILSWYGSDNPGVLKNLRWMLDSGRLAGTGKLVILPVDQGFEHGPARSFAK